MIEGFPPVFRGEIPPGEKRKEKEKSGPLLKRLETIRNRLGEELKRTNEETQRLLGSFPEDLGKRKVQELVGSLRGLIKERFKVSTIAVKNAGILGASLLIVFSGVRPVQGMEYQRQESESQNIPYITSATEVKKAPPSAVIIVEGENVKIVEPLGLVQIPEELLVPLVPLLHPEEGTGILPNFNNKKDKREWYNFDQKIGGKIEPLFGALSEKERIVIAVKSFNENTGYNKNVLEAMRMIREVASGKLVRGPIVSMPLLEHESDKNVREIYLRRSSETDLKYREIVERLRKGEGVCYEYAIGFAIYMARHPQYFPGGISVDVIRGELKSMPGEHMAHAVIVYEMGDKVVVINPVNSSNPVVDFQDYVNSLSHWLCNPQIRTMKGITKYIEAVRKMSSERMRKNQRQGRARARLKEQREREEVSRKRALQSAEMRKWQ